MPATGNSHPSGPPRVPQRVRGELRRAAESIAELGRELRDLHATRHDARPLYGERLGLLLGRRVEEVEGAVAVAMALADRTGAELHQEIQSVAESLAGQLEGVARMARAAAASASSSDDPRALELRFDDVHRRIDAVTRELRAGVASLDRRRVPAPPPYAGRLALVLSRRIEHVEGATAVASALAERIGVEMREELDHVTATGEERAASIARVLERLERDRDAVTSQALHAGEAWAAERAALQERVAELAARIVTGPADASADADWPSARAFDQLRISVEGLRMRLAYHEKTVAELAGARVVDERIEELHQLLRRLESAGVGVRDERDTVLEQLERVASRMDQRLQQLETSPS